MSPREHSPHSFLMPQGAYHAQALVSLVRLHWFVRLRWLFVLAALSALALERVLRPEAVLPRGLPAIMSGANNGMPAGDYVTRVEFNEFKESLMERLKSFIGELA